MKAKHYQLKEITLEALRCGVGACPTMYESKELTPTDMQCCIGSCPGVYETENTPPNVERCIGGIACPTLYHQGDSYLIVGKVISKEEARGISIGEGRTLADKIGEGEALVCVPKGLLAEINKSA